MTKLVIRPTTISSFATFISIVASLARRPAGGRTFQIYKSSQLQNFGSVGTKGKERKVTLDEEEKKEKSDLTCSTGALSAISLSTL